MMKKSMKLAFGATLLEIMLVLAIAAMVIVMSIRFYKGASDSQNANALLSLVQGIGSAADKLYQGTGNYTGATTTNIASMLNGTTVINTAFGTATVTGTSVQTYTVSFPAVPPSVCTQLSGQLASNTKYTSVSSCGTTAAAFTYIYDSTK